ncbi:Trypsin [Lentzea albidocapillata subsp. violacea]|uniref:Trypsin n=1 Tax=Lentzea albidocapillata subsp. violacea TaxID=128104 RepID=A0A1G8SDL0_9PSEU|nr:trypsin-like serine protease [Lentzea albidocapillata]SDJ26750.1 Trypsin [Lentzea albidocapillata subsp. violacea]
MLRHKRIALIAATLALGTAVTAASAAPHDRGNSYADSSVSTWDGASGQIYQGQDATVAEYPGVIANLRSEGGRPKGQSCTGAVIGPRHILTAAHCKDLAGTKTFLYGLDDLAAGTGTTLTTKSYVKHPQYINWDQGYDVAVITTNEDIPLSPDKWAKYATSADAGIWKVGDTGRSYGYGKKTHDDSPADVSLDKQDFPIVDGVNQCQGVAAGYKLATMICAGYPDGRTTILPGDSGGPFVVNGKIVGLASWSRSDFRWYGVFARLDNDMGDWVKQQVGDTQPAEFGVSVDPSSLRVTAGSAGSVAVKTTAGSTAEDVALSVSGLPSGVQASFQPSSVKSGEGSKLSVSVASGTPDGTHQVTVTGRAASGVSKQATLTLTIGAGSPGSDFALGLSPASVKAAPGGHVSTTVTSQVVGSPADISLSASGLPSGAQAVFQPSTITSGGTAKLTVTTSSSTPAGTYSVKVTGTSGSVSRDATLTLTVGDGNPQPGGLTVALSPPTGSTFKGGAVFPSISVTGATGPVTLTASGQPAGVTVFFNPATVNPGQTSLAHIATSFSTPPGTYRIKITASGDGKSGSADFTLTVT